MTTQGFISAFWMISHQVKSIGEQFHKVRQLYEIHEIQNEVLDGTMSFPEDSRSLATGITVEFRYVLCSSCPLVFQMAEVFWFLVHLEMSPSAIPARKTSRSVMYRSKSKRVNSVSVQRL